MIDLLPYKLFLYKMSNPSLLHPHQTTYTVLHYQHNSGIN